MRIIQTLDTLGRGGAEIQVLDICRNAASHGLDIIFVCFGDGPLKDEFQKLDIPFIHIQRSLPIDLTLINKLRNIIKSNKVDIVHSYQPVEGIHAYLATLGSNVKRVLSFQGFIQDEKNRLAAKFLIPRVHANIVASNGLKQWLKNSAGLDVETNFHLVYNGADPKRIITKNPSLRKELNVDDKEMLIGMIGNFYSDPRKDQMTICKSLPRILSEIPKVRCVFVGRVEKGAERKFNECIEFCNSKGILDKVHFLGPRNDIPEVLASLDLFVFSSLHEGLPLAVSEAMLAGIPTILSDIPPLLEMSENGRYAAIFQTQNENDLAEKIIELLKNKERRILLSNEARKFALQNFSICAHLEKLKLLYSQILSS